MNHLLKVIEEYREKTLGSFPGNNKFWWKKFEDAYDLDKAQSNQVEAQVSLQETEVKLIKTFMNILKRIYAKTDLVDIQTEIESSFENLDDLLLNEYKIDSDISLLSN